jgi:hypothetical protein
VTRGPRRRHPRRSLEDEEEEHGGEDAEPRTAEGMFVAFTVEKSTSGFRQR